MIATVAAGCYLVLAGLPAGATGHDPFTGPVQVLRYSFDNEDELDLLPGLWQPRGWTRRKGPRFPSFVVTGIDRSRGQGSRHSLKFELNGGQAITYSPPVPIDSLHSYVFQGYIRTQRLKHDAALLSVSFLNHKRQRVQRFLSKPVSGTHRDWVRVRIGPMAPRDDVRFVVVGCHLTHHRKMDISGSVWFDELFLGKLPQLSLASDYQSHFKQRLEPIEITARASGLDLQRLADIPSGGTPAIVDALDAGQVPAELSRRLVGLISALSDQAEVKIEQEGRWLLTDGARRFLIVQTDPHALRVYDARSPYTLRMRILDSAGQVINEAHFPLAATLPRQPTAAEPDVPTTWRLGAKDYGYYRVQAALERDGAVILEKQTSFAVIEPTGRLGRGRFGWSIGEGDTGLSPRDLADIAGQAGINWLKHPVWQAACSDDPRQVQKLDELFDRLVHRGITPVGVLSDPPPHIRGKFARDWAGISEIFTLPRRSWSPWLEPVIVRYSSNVQHWQLGGDDDVSLVGISDLPQTVRNVKQEFDRLGRNMQIGFRWNWQTPLPPREKLPQTFLAFGDSLPAAADPAAAGAPRPMTGPQLTARLQRIAESNFPQWVTIKPQSRRVLPDRRGADLVKRMLAAKIGGAGGIFAANVIDPKEGLLQPGGAPTELFLPWRTAALALQDTEFLGSFTLAGGSTNYVFARGDEAILFLWNDDADVTEEIALGPSRNITIVDLWGRQQTAPTDEATGRQRIEVGARPKIVRGCSRAIAQWMLAARLEKPRLPSATGRHRNAIAGHNTFPQGVNGRATIRVPPEWQAEPTTWEFPLGPGETFRLPLVLTIPPNTSLGPAMLTIDFEIDADRVHKFQVRRPVEIGLGDVSLHVVDRKLDDGRVEIQQIIVNRTRPEEVLNFHCSLFSRNNRRQKKRVTRLGNGQNVKKYYLPGAEALRGTELWLRAIEVNGRRVLNYRWKMGEHWDLTDEEFQQLLQQLLDEGSEPPGIE